jgi:hypothetical protein
MSCRIARRASATVAYPTSEILSPLVNSKKNTIPAEEGLLDEVCRRGEPDAEAEAIVIERELHLPVQAVATASSVPAFAAIRP